MNFPLRWARQWGNSSRTARLQAGPHCSTSTSCSTTLTRCSKTSRDTLLPLPLAASIPATHTWKIRCWSPYNRNFYHHHHHHHLSLNREGRWGPADDFATSFLHLSLFSTALWDLANSKPVLCLMLSSILFFCLPCLLPPFIVPCKS